MGRTKEKKVRMVVAVCPSPKSTRPLTKSVSVYVRNAFYPGSARMDACMLTVIVHYA